MASFAKPVPVVCLSSSHHFLSVTMSWDYCSVLGLHSFQNQENLALSHPLSWVVSSQPPDLLNSLKLSPDTQLPAPTPPVSLKTGSGT